VHRTDVALECPRGCIQPLGEAFPYLGGGGAGVGDDEDIAWIGVVVFEDGLDAVKEGGRFSAAGAAEQAGQCTVRTTHCRTHM
jgi:hypothetical protein